MPGCCVRTNSLRRAGSLLSQTSIILATLLHTSLSSGSDLDSALGGFDEIETAVVDPLPPSSTSDSPYGVVTGSVALSSSINLRSHESSNGTNWQGLSKLRTRLNLEYNLDVATDWQLRVAGYAFYDSMFSRRDRSDYSDAVLDAYESEGDFQEVWIRGKLNSQLDVRFGRQVVNWGRADSLRVLDILNPLDNREPGLADIEDLRLPVTMLKADYYIDSHWNTSFIVIPEVRFSKNAPYGSDYYVEGSSDFPENRPDHISDSSYAFAVNGIFSGWDISLHAARYWRDTPYLKPVFTPGPTPLDGSTFEHSRLTLFGAGGNYTQGAWLYKGEFAWLQGIDYTLHTDEGIFGVLPTDTTRKDRFDALLGIEYFGIPDSSFSVELAHQYIPDYEQAMKPSYEERNVTALALRATHSMLNDRLDLTAVVFGNFGESGGGARFDAEYDLQDALVLSGGVIFYEKGDAPPFNTYYKNDRLFAEIKYSF